MCNYNAHIKDLTLKKILHNKKKVGKNKTGAEYTKIVRVLGISNRSVTKNLRIFC